MSSTEQTGGTRGANNDHEWNSPHISPLRESISEPELGIRSGMSHQTVSIANELSQGVDRPPPQSTFGQPLYRSEHVVDYDAHSQYSHQQSQQNSAVSYTQSPLPSPNFSHIDNMKHFEPWERNPPHNPNKNFQRSTSSASVPSARYFSGMRKMSAPQTYSQGVHARSRSQSLMSAPENVAPYAENVNMADLAGLMEKEVCINDEQLKQGSHPDVDETHSRAYSEERPDSALAKTKRRRMKPQPSSTSSASPPGHNHSNIFGSRPQSNQGMGLGIGIPPQQGGTAHNLTKNEWFELNSATYSDSRRHSQGSSTHSFVSQSTRQISTSQPTSGMHAHSPYSEYGKSPSMGNYQQAEESVGSVDIKRGGVDASNCAQPNTSMMRHNGHPVDYDPGTVVPHEAESHYGSSGQYYGGVLSATNQTSQPPGVLTTELDGGNTSSANEVFPDQTPQTSAPRMLDMWGQHTEQSEYRPVEELMSGTGSGTEVLRRPYVPYSQIAEEQQQQQQQQQQRQQHQLQPQRNQDEHRTQHQGSGKYHALTNNSGDQSSWSVINPNWRLASENSSVPQFSDPFVNQRSQSEPGSNQSHSSQNSYPYNEKSINANEDANSPFPRWESMESVPAHRSENHTYRANSTANLAALPEGTGYEPTADGASSKPRRHTVMMAMEGSESVPDYLSANRPSLINQMSASSRCSTEHPSNKITATHPPTPISGIPHSYSTHRPAADDLIVDVPGDDYDPVAKNVVWSDEAVSELLGLLDSAEKQKWKYISESLKARRQGKRIPVKACRQKFEALFGEAEASSVLQTSLFYVAYRSGWAAIRDIRTNDKTEMGESESQMGNHPDAASPTAPSSNATKSMIGDSEPHEHDYEYAKEQKPHGNPLDSLSIQGTLTNDNELSKVETLLYEQRVVEDKKRRQMQLQKMMERQNQNIQLAPNNPPMNSPPRQLSPCQTDQYDMQTQNFPADEAEYAHLDIDPAGDRGLTAVEQPWPPDTRAVNSQVDIDSENGLTNITLPEVSSQANLQNTELTTTDPANLLTGQIASHPMSEKNSHSASSENLFAHSNIAGDLGSDQ